MGLYRSELMRLYQLTVPKDDAWDVMNKFGDLGMAHFIDLNKEESPYNLPYTQQIKSCEETERKLALLLDQCKRNYVKVTPPENIQGFLYQLKRIKDNKRKAINLLLEEIQKDVSQQDAFIQEQNVQMKESEAVLNNLKDCLQVYKVANLMIPQLQGQFNEQLNDIENRAGDDQVGLIDEQQKSINIQHVAGVIEQSEIERLRRLIFRSTKGKSYMYIQEYQDDDDSKKKRSVYIIVFWDGNHIRERIQKICDSFSGQRFELPDFREITQQMAKIENSIHDARNVFEKTKQSLRDQLTMFDKIEGDVGDGQGGRNSSTIYIYKMFLAKEKALYKTLNQMKWQNQTFIGYFWAPIDQENTIKGALQNYSAAKIQAYENHTIPKPTYFKITDFTYVFQLIVDTYGVPTYLEANPAVISIVTFPFFFGMMFGDMGHGFIVFLFGAILTLFNNQLKGTALQPFLPARYLFLLQGFMATYCGLIYNEFFAISTNIWDSCYQLDNRQRWNSTMDAEKQTIAGEFIYKRTSIDCNYPAGQDPAWSLTSNRLSFVNSVKMKMSVIFAIVHMTIGIIIKGTNNFYFKQYIDFFSEVVTGLVILLGLFGFMDLLIILKWFKYVNIEDRNPSEVTVNFDSDTTAGDNQIQRFNGDVENERMPSIIQIMITAVFNFGAHDANDKTYPLIGKDLDAQYNIAVTLLIIVVILIPIMLLTKPLLLAQDPAQEEDDDEIEFTNINRADNEMQQNLIQPGIQASGSIGSMDDSKKFSDEMMQKRHNEMKSLEKQLRDMGDKHGGHTFGELFIHQMIETIEFVLGTVSNTASYLRLWALSLAHGQLAETFFDLVFKMTFQQKNLFTTIIVGLILWPIFWSISFGVLILMDQLECFLHTLRLHWVEFQNKFYKGEGYSFKPYSYEVILGNVLEN